MLCQFIEAADSRHLCTLLGVCSDGAANSEAAAQHMLRQRNLLSSVLARLQGQSNDACDVCKVGGGSRTTVGAMVQLEHLMLFKLLRSKVPDNECNKHSCHHSTGQYTCYVALCLHN